MIGSVLSEGLKGIQSSQREMVKSAHQIASANVKEEPEASNTLPNANNDPSTLSPVERPQESFSTGDIAEPLIELRRQEQLFDASAKVLSVADETLGSIIDVKS